MVGMVKSKIMSKVSSFEIITFDIQHLPDNQITSKKQDPVKADLPGNPKVNFSAITRAVRNTFPMKLHSEFPTSRTLRNTGIVRGESSTRMR